MRLTKQDGCYCDGCGVKDDRCRCDDEYAMYEKLKLYEDAEEQGRLVILPCKVGETVFSVFEDEDVFCGKVYAGLTWDGTNWFSVLYDSGLRYDHRLDEIGKTVFLTRKEAEAALKGETEDV